MTCDEAQQLITAWVDGELLDPERSSLETHLVECVGCRRTLEEERALKQAIRGYRERIHASGELRRRILSDQRIFPEQQSSPRSWRDYVRTLPHPVSAALAVALLLAIALPTFVFLRSSREPIAVAALESYDRFIKGQLPVRRTDNANEIVEQLTRAVGGHFHPWATILQPWVDGPWRAWSGRLTVARFSSRFIRGKGGLFFATLLSGLK
jgi:hypothetical protein